MYTHSLLLKALLLKVSIAGLLGMNFLVLPLKASLNIFCGFSTSRSPKKMVSATRYIRPVVVKEQTVLCPNLCPAKSYYRRSVRPRVCTKTVTETYYVPVCTPIVRPVYPSLFNGLYQIFGW